LITRAIEVPTDSAVFENFRKYFIQAGLIGERFAPVIAAAQRNDTEALNQQEEEVFALLVEQFLPMLSDVVRGRVGIELFPRIGRVGYRVYVEHGGRLLKPV